MRIASYNIWNSVAGMPRRERQIANEISALNADIIGLQEVKSKAYSERLFQCTGYEHYCFSPHKGQEEGLAVYSKYPIAYSKYTDFALIVIVDVMGKSVLLVNVHLPSESVIGQEECTVSVIKEIATIASDYRFILGDFNCSTTSSVYQYLSGYRSLNGTEVMPYWHDLGSVASEALGIKEEMTLDLLSNPRWKGRSIPVLSQRVDLIFIQDCYPQPYPSLVGFSYFGKAVDEESGFCASDHYGVCAELQMP